MPSLRVQGLLKQDRWPIVADFSFGDVGAIRKAPSLGLYKVTRVLGLEGCWGHRHTTYYISFFRCFEPRGIDGRFTSCRSSLVDLRPACILRGVGFRAQGWGCGLGDLGSLEQSRTCLKRENLKLLGTNPSMVDIKPTLTTVVSGLGYIALWVLDFNV